MHFASGKDMNLVKRAEGGLLQTELFPPTTHAEVLITDSCTCDLKWKQVFVDAMGPHQISMALMACDMSLQDEAQKEDGGLMVRCRQQGPQAAGCLGCWTLETNMATAVTVLLWTPRIHLYPLLLLEAVTDTPPLSLHVLHRAACTMGSKLSNACPSALLASAAASQMSV